MAAYANWTYVLTDLLGNNIGEIRDATERTLTRALSAPATAGFKILATNPLLTDILGSGAGNNLKVYRNNVLQFHGPILTAQLAAEDATATPTVVCTAADPAFRFERRVAGQSAAGTTFPGTDRLTVAESLISAANG